MVSEVQKEVSWSHRKTRQSLVLRLRQEVVQLTRDVQHLARFIGVQRTGFRKLLKKYKKWSHSSSLSEQFLPVLEAPTSFTNQDFTSTFLELSLLYNVLRQAKLTSITVTPHVYPSNENLCMFDCEMVTAISNSVTFWIHPDNMVETKIALLRNLSLVSDSSASLQSSTSFSNLASLNQGSPTKHSDNVGHSGESSSRDAPPVSDLTYTTYLDNSKKFYSIQTNSEPGQIRSVNGANTSSTPVLCSPVGGLRHFCIANLSLEQADLVAKSQYEALTGTLKGMDNMSKVALSWVQKRQAAPISKISSQRARFRYSERVNDLSAGSGASSPNTHMDSPDIWATLDNNIKMTKSGASQPQWPADEDPQDVSEFPYCVLEIRWKGLDKPAWVTELERSHLVYPVKGFSMYAHSVAHYYPSSLSILPQWLDLINGQVDIRRAPKPRVSSGTLSKRHSKSSTSISTQIPISPGILLNNEREPLLRTTSSKSLGRHHASRQDYGSHTDSDLSASELKSANQPVVRYWNEFDDPEDGPDEGVFVVIPDEDMEDGLFNEHDVAFLVSLGESLFAKAASLKTKVQRLFGYKPKRRPRRGLSTIYEDEDEDDEDDDTEFEGFYSPRFKSHHNQHHVHDLDGDYFSFNQSPATDQRNSILAIFYSICFFLSALMVCTLFGVLLGEDMTAISMGTYVFIVSGFFIALGISVLAMGLFFLRADMPPWWHQTIVFTTFFSIICFGVGGVAWLFT